MKKYVVETYYTCTFKTVHTLDNLDDTELSKIDKRTDGDVEVIDVKLNNRKTKKVGGKKEEKPDNKKIVNDLPKNVINKIKKIHPLIGVDINSRFEFENLKKDVDKIKLFKNKLSL